MADGFIPPVFHQQWEELLEENRIALDIWVEYYRRAEEYDRTLPGHWSKRAPDEWLPAPTHRIFMARAARSMMREARARLRCNGISLGVSRAAQKHANMMSFKELREHQERRRYLRRDE